jgi:hypothetical protein
VITLYCINKKDIRKLKMSDDFKKIENDIDSHAYDENEAF